MYPKKEKTHVLMLAMHIRLMATETDFSYGVMLGERRIGQLGFNMPDPLVLKADKTPFTLSSRVGPQSLNTGQSRVHPGFRPCLYRQNIPGDWPG